MTDYDAIVIGAGHNGLVCAALLAKAGRKVLVLESRQTVGGAAATEEFVDGFSVSSAAHLLMGLQPPVVKDLGLSPVLASDNLWTLSLAADGPPVRLREGIAEGVVHADQEAMQAFHKRMTGHAKLLRAQLNRRPPRLGVRKRKDLFGLAKLGFDVRRLGRDNMRDFLRIIGMNIYDELEECFESPALKGALSLDAVLGTHLGPRSPNTMLSYLYRLAADGGRVSVPAGGMGAISQMMAKQAQHHGAVIKTGQAVKRVVVENGRAIGVETDDGSRFDSLTIVSNADPKQTVMRLVGVEHLETGFVRRVHNLRMRGNAAKLHLALDHLPTIPGIELKDMGERMVIAPSPDYVEKAFNPAKYGEYSTQPVIELTFPSFRDASLAPAGKHVMSAIVQYAPYELTGGWDDAARDGLLRVILDTLSPCMPDLESRIEAAELLLPVDIEERFGIGGGHWHHGELTLDQFMFVRPVGGAAQYATPLEGLYFCGAGAHPGGNVAGAAGRNAAREILYREKGV